MAQNIKLIKAWLQNGAPPIEDLAPIMNLHDINLNPLMAGKLKPDNSTKELFSALFDQPVYELFPED